MKWYNKGFLFALAISIAFFFATNSARATNKPAQNEWEINVNNTNKPTAVASSDANSSAVSGAESSVTLTDNSSNTNSQQQLSDQTLENTIQTAGGSAVANGGAGGEARSESSADSKLSNIGNPNVNVTTIDKRPIVINQPPIIQPADINRSYGYLHGYREIIGKGEALIVVDTYSRDASEALKACKPRKSRPDYARKWWGARLFSSRSGNYDDTFSMIENSWKKAPKDTPMILAVIYGATDTKGGLISASNGEYSATGATRALMGSLSGSYAIPFPGGVFYFCTTYIPKSQ